MLRPITLLLLALQITACSDFTPHSGGEPTPLRGGETPLEALCRIQTEFRALPKPLLKEIVHHQPWSESRFAAGTTHYGAFDEVVLTEAGYSFYRRHTVREILVAITPLLLDPQLGGEAAVLLSGPPVAKKSVASSVHAGEFLKRLDYRSPAHPGGWDEQSAARLVGHPGVGFDRFSSPPIGTLDEVISTILREEYQARSRSQAGRYAPYQPYPPLHLTREYPDLDTWAAAHFDKLQPLPAFTTFLERRGDPFTAAVLLASGLADTTLIWLLDMEQHYWPTTVHLHVDTGGHLLNTIRQRQRDFPLLAARRVFSQLARACPTP